MSSPGREALWEQLRGAGLVEGAFPDRAAAGSPWFVRVMLGCAGWFGAVFLLGAVGVGLQGVFGVTSALLVLGAIACTVATVIFRGAPRSAFLAQFAFAVSLAGQALLLFGWVKLFERTASGVAFAFALQQALLFVLMPNPLHRVWTAWSGAHAVTIVLAELGWHPFAPAVVTAGCLAVWLHELAQPRRGGLLRAGGYGLALAAVQVAVQYGGKWDHWLARNDGQSVPVGELVTWAGALAGAAVLLWLVLTLLRRAGVPPASGPGKIVIVGATILALTTIKAPGLAPAVAVLLVGFANGNRVLVGLGIFALLGYLSAFYYSLQETLLVKSALLASTGAALLLVRLLLHRWWPTPATTQEENRHA